MTGSTTMGPNSLRLIATATHSIISVDDSIPVLTTSMPISCATTSIWSEITSTGTSAIDTTSKVFCAVMAVTALVPKTPCAASVFRSAWIPAPPPESEPAIVITTGMGLVVMT